MHNAALMISTVALAEVFLAKHLPKSPNRNQLRIIGGKWRGRKIQFPDVEGLRPTTDRVRETLFNWLSGWIEGSSCLDLFAGSGALGLEACSRGASDVVLADQQHEVIKALTAAKSVLNADNVTVIQTDAERYLNRVEGSTKFDMIFLDPPFAYPDLNNLLITLTNSQVLKPNSWIYLESAANRAIVLPSSWRLHRQKQAGQVDYRLFQFQASNTDSTAAPSVA